MEDKLLRITDAPFPFVSLCSVTRVYTCDTTITSVYACNRTVTCVYTCVRTVTCVYTCARTVTCVCTCDRTVICVCTCDRTVICVYICEGAVTCVNNCERTVIYDGISRKVPYKYPVIDFNSNVNGLKTEPTNVNIFIYWKTRTGAERVAELRR